MLSQYQNYAPLWEKEELERSERWDAFLAHFETAYYKDTKQYVSSCKIFMCESAQGCHCLESKVHVQEAKQGITA